MKKIAKFRSEFLHQLVGENENFSEEEFRTRLKEYLEQGDHATAPAAATSMETAPAPSASIGMIMPSAVHELRGRENLATFLQHFYTWACITGCDSALDSDVIVKTSGIPRAELESLHDRTLVHKSLQVWQSLTKSFIKEIGQGTQCSLASTIGPSTVPYS